MFEEYEKKKKQQVSLMRSLLDYGMGIIITLVGIFFFFRDQFDLPLNKSYPPDGKDKLLGVIFVIYGVWRTYRGYKKNYFK
jgi:hypothetical protein